MLKIIRDNLKYLSWILWATIAIFVLFIFADFGGGFMGTGGASTAAATVGGSQVSMHEFLRTYRQMQEQYRQAYGAQFTADVEKQLKLPLQALDKLVAQKVLLEEAKHLGFATSDRELRQAILDMKAFKEQDGSFIGEQQYAAVLRANDHTPESFEALLREELTVGKLTSALSQTVTVSDQEVEKSYRQQAERAKIRYFVVPSGRFTATASPAEVAAYFNAHKEEFRLPEQRVVDYLLVDNAKLAAGLNVSEADARAYYDQHKDEFNQEEQVHARHILILPNDKRTDAQAKALLEQAKAKLEKGADFAALAKELSEDPGSKDRGGDLGYFGRGRMVKEFEDAAFAAKPGEIVGPIKSEFGWHLIKVEDHRPGGLRPFEDVRLQIETRLRGERAQTAAEAKAGELSTALAKQSTVNLETLRAQAGTAGGCCEVGTTPPFGQNEFVPGFGRGGPFAAAAFAGATGKPSAPVKVARGYAILVVREVKAPRLPELAEAEARVRQTLEAQKREDLAMAEASRLKAELAAGKPMDEVAKGAGAQVQESQEFNRMGYIPGLGASPQIADAAFALEQGQFGGPVNTQQGPVVFQVTEHKRFDPADFAKQKDQIRSSLERDAVSKLLASLIEQKRQELKVTYDRRLLEQYGILDENGKQG
ncbi:MAG: peptidyl-prolyl cis-trans isomerase [Acidobacteriota bacterium]